MGRSCGRARRGGDERKRLEVIHAYVGALRACNWRPPPHPPSGRANAQIEPHANTHKYVRPTPRSPPSIATLAPCSSHIHAHTTHQTLHEGTRALLSGDLGHAVADAGIWQHTRLRVRHLPRAHESTHTYAHAQFRAYSPSAHWRACVRACVCVNVCVRACACVGARARVWARSANLEHEAGLDNVDGGHDDGREPSSNRAQDHRVPLVRRLMNTGGRAGRCGGGEGGGRAGGWEMVRARAVYISRTSGEDFSYM